MLVNSSLSIFLNIVIILSHLLGALLSSSQKTKWAATGSMMLIKTL